MNRLLRKVRRAVAGEGEGFTIVELTMVMIISVIMFAGMAALIWGAFNLFNSSKDLQAINDSSRKLLASMSRMLKPALHFVNAECSESQVSFYADVDGDEGNNADVRTGHWNLTDKVIFKLVGTDAVMSMTDYNSGSPITVPDANMGSYVSSLKFFYFQRGIVPTGNPFDPSNKLPAGSDYNLDAGMIRIVVKFSKGDARRTFFQDVFLRVLVRED